MKSTIEMTVADLTQMVQAVGEYNGVKVNAVEFIKDGQPFVPDRIVLVGESAGFAVRVAKEEKHSLSDLLREVRQSYVGMVPKAEGQNGHGTSDQ